MKRKKNPAEPMRVGRHTFTVVYTPAEEGGYIVTCPALPGLVTEGDTLREARQMAQEAIEGYVEVLLKEGARIPADKSRFEEVAIEVYT